MIKLIALDLDGTIVNEKLEISARTLRLLNHVIHHTQVRVVIATGRMHASALQFAHSIGIREPLISYQGAMIRSLGENGRLLYHQPIEVPLAQAVLKLLLAQDYSVNLYVNDILYTNHANHHATYYARVSGVTPVISDNLMAALTAPASKMMAIDDERLDGLMETLRNQFPGKLNFCRSRTNFCEIIHADTSKWNAIKSLADAWGIASSEVLAIGDQENDLSMITHAGIGVAMGNAPEHVRERANYVTRTIHEDGAAEAIEKFVLGDFPLAETSPSETSIV